MHFMFFIARIYIFKKEVKSKSNTPGIKRSGQVLKSLVEKDVKTNGQSRFPIFDWYKSFDHNDFIANIVISSAQSLLMLVGSKILIDDQAAKQM